MAMVYKIIEKYKSYGSYLNYDRKRQRVGVGEDCQEANYRDVMHSNHKLSAIM